MKNLYRRRRGVSQIEYGILAGIIAVGSIGATTSIGKNTSNMYCMISSHLSSNSSTCGGNGNNTSTVVDNPYVDKSYTATGSQVQLWQDLSRLNFSSITGVYTADGVELRTMQQINGYYGLQPWSDINSTENQSIVNSAQGNGKQVVFPGATQISWESEDTGVPFMYSSQTTNNGIVYATYKPLWGSESPVTLALNSPSKP